MARPPHLNLVDSPVTPGIRLGAYQLLEPIGEGGMAEVWKGVRQVGVGNTGKTVAIKLIASHAALNPDYQRTFLREARVSLLLSHANIAQVFDVDIDRETKQLYMAMEYVHGLNLHQFIQRLRRDPVPYPMIGYVIGEVLRGLTYAHEVEQDGENIAIVHRDISPHNIMVSTSGEVKITDFGIASIATEATTGTIKGKLQYMPPEQLLGDSRNPTVDLFSVGAVLHELIEGKPFRNAVDSARMYGMILSGAKPDLERPDVPSGLRVLRDRLLEVDVTKRAPSARLALEYLYRWDGYRNASLDLGKLVKELLHREEATDERGMDYSDTLDGPPAGAAHHPPFTAMPPEAVPGELESQILTERPSTPESRIHTEQLSTPESRVPTEQPLIPESRIPTEQAEPGPTRAATMISTSSPPTLGGVANDTSLGVSFPVYSDNSANIAVDPKRARVAAVVVFAIAILALIVVVSGFLSGWWSDEKPVVADDLPVDPSSRTTNDLAVHPVEADLVQSSDSTDSTGVGESSDTTATTSGEDDAGETSATESGVEPPVDQPKDERKMVDPPPPPTSATLTASSDYKLWVEIKIGNSSYVVDWPDPTASIKVRPGSHWVKYRREAGDDWSPIGQVRIPRTGPIQLTLRNDKLHVE